MKGPGSSALLEESQRAQRGHGAGSTEAATAPGQAGVPLNKKGVDAVPIEAPSAEREPSASSATQQGEKRTGAVGAVGVAVAALTVTENENHAVQDSQESKS